MGQVTPFQTQNLSQFDRQDRPLKIMSQGMQHALCPWWKPHLFVTADWPTDIQRSVWWLVNLFSVLLLSEIPLGCVVCKVCSRSWRVHHGYVQCVGNIILPQNAVRNRWILPSSWLALGERKWRPFFPASSSRVAVLIVAGGPKPTAIIFTPLP